MTRHLIGTDATLAIDGYEDVSLRVKPFPWPSTVAGYRSGKFQTHMVLLRYLLFVEQSMLEGELDARKTCPPLSLARLATTEGMKPKPNRNNLTDRWGRLK